MLIGAVKRPAIINAEGPSEVSVTGRLLVLSRIATTVTNLGLRQIIERMRRQKSVANRQTFALQLVRGGGDKLDLVIARLGKESHATADLVIGAALLGSTFQACGRQRGDGAVFVAGVNIAITLIEALERYPVLSN